jgi:hypothetical protein
MHDRGLFLATHNLEKSYIPTLNSLYKQEKIENTIQIYLFSMVYRRSG